jgi:hypothetical protein
MARKECGGTGFARIRGIPDLSSPPAFVSVINIPTIERK